MAEACKVALPTSNGLPFTGANRTRKSSALGGLAERLASGAAGVVDVKLTALDVLEIRAQFRPQVREQLSFRAPFTLFDHRKENHSGERIDANEIYA